MEKINQLFLPPSYSNRGSIKYQREQKTMTQWLDLLEELEVEGYITIPTV